MRSDLIWRILITTRDSPNITCLPSATVEITILSRLAGTLEMQVNTDQNIKGMNALAVKSLVLITIASAANRCRPHLRLRLTISEETLLPKGTVFRKGNKCEVC